MAPVLGIVADDFTGATDIASTLVKGGMRAIQTVGVPRAGLDLGDVDAVIVALKSRSNPPSEAVAMSLDALAALRRIGCRRFFFKYCSTFDSTDRGNIGPVADALLDALGADRTIFCPAFPVNGRTIFNGHLFVGDVLLSESGMRDHPITPMTDANLVRVLARQTARRTGLVPWRAVAAGAGSVREALDRLVASGIPYAVVDAVRDEDLMAIGEACGDLPLVTGGSGVAMGLPEAYRRRGLLAARTGADALAVPAGPAAAVSGSCSTATNAQVAAFRASGGRVFALLPERLFDGTDVVREALDWARGAIGAGPVLVASTDSPAGVRAAQERHGQAETARRVEDALGRIARGLVDMGVGRLVAAGGETSGAVVGALGIEALAIGAEIDPGVPWTAAVGGKPLALALKSGNFGAPDFFAKALGAKA